MLSSTSSIKWPIIGTWGIEGGEAIPGILFIEDEKLFLRLYFEIPFPSPTPIRNALETHPKLAPFRSPNRPTILGQARAAGKITLFNCVLNSDEVTQQLDPPVSRIEITLFVPQAWAGEGLVNCTASYGGLNFAAPGLHSVLSPAHIESKWLINSTPERESDTHKLKELTGANQAFLFYRGQEPWADIKNDGKQYKIVFATSVGQSSSNTEGVTFGTTDVVRIETSGATIPELMAVAYQIEQFLSLLCVGPFRAESIKVVIDEIHSVELIWSLGREERHEKLKTMPHQILASIGRHPHLAASALSAWFEAPDSRRLARWLIFDSLFQANSSTSKFIAVAQAWEILGREKGNAAVHDKRTYQKACKAARVALETFLDADTVNRLYTLALSSNKKSFGDMIRAVISEIPTTAVQALCKDIDEFVTTVVSVRNVLTHMEGKKKLPIESASYLSLFLTYKLIVLFCIYDCISLGLPIDNLQMMLNNNHTAIAALRPLPKI